MVSNEKNYYDILEVATDADADEIRTSYIRAKNAYSHNGLALYSLMGQDECKNMLEKLEEAYMILSDDSKRKEYDRVHKLNIGMNFQIPREYQRSTESLPNTQSTTGGKSIGNIVAGRKFALNYDINSDFEQEIEQTQEFSGEFLKKIREYKSVDMKRMSELTRVSEINIRYIEDENHQALPALVYVRGFVYQYAKCLRLPPDDVASSYTNRLKKICEKSS